jgi:hypothetical protein
VERFDAAAWLGAVVEETDRRAFVLRFIGGGCWSRSASSAWRGLLPVQNFDAGSTA